MYVVGTDKYAAQSFKYITFNITNAYNLESRLEILKNLSLALAKDNSTYINLQVSNFFFIAFEPPRLSVASGVLCMSDWHCFSP